VSVIDPQDPEEPNARRRLLLAAIGVGVTLVAGAVLVFRPARGPEAPAPAAVPAQPDAPPSTTRPRADAESAAPAATTPPRARPARRDAAPAETVSTAPAPVHPLLIVDSDVPGASVFVDRQYLGTTPLRTTAVAPGTHQLNASAEGQEGIVRTIEVGDTGDTEVVLRFREVRLDESVVVVHKHGMGSCEGRLVASLAGLRYVTPNKGDAFTLPFAEVEAFEVDYLQKNLRVRKRGGRTWNFTDRSENADSLFVFHRDVSKAREKLSAAGR
jgi:hypothetical protein